MVAALSGIVPHDTRKLLQLRREQPTIEYVELTQCPYDRTPIEAESLSGGSMLLTCPPCAAAWEWHGAWLRRVREPDRDAC